MTNRIPAYIDLANDVYSKLRAIPGVKGIVIGKVNQKLKFIVQVDQNDGIFDKDIIAIIEASPYYDSTGMTRTII